MAAKTSSRQPLTYLLVLLGIFLTGRASADDSLQGYFIYDFFGELCPISAASFPNLQSVDADSLEPETKAVVEFYQFVVGNFSGYCLVELRLKDQTTQDVFIPQQDYNSLWDLKTSKELREREMTYLVQMKTEVITDADSSALKGYELSYELVQRRPEIVE